MNKETFLSLKEGDVVWADGVTYEVISAEGDKRTLRSGLVPHEEINMTPGHFLVPSLLPWHRAEES
jgi:predicted component of type VI protein secretion system